MHAFSLVLSLALPVAACSGHGGPAPTLDELKQASYRGLDLPQEPITLKDGRWEGAREQVTWIRGAFAAGDLDRASGDEAAVMLTRTGMGSGGFSYLAVVRRSGDRLDNVSTVLVGDRVQTRAMRIREGKVEVDLVQAGPSDAACCPGDLVTRSWSLASGRLVETGPPQPSGRLALSAIGPGTWVLRRWTWDQPAPEKPEVTLSFRDGALSGSAGCNHYTATALDGPSPGDVTVSRAMGTLMACPEPIMEVEARFLGQIAAVTKFGFGPGQLLLTYTADGAVQTMILEVRP